MKTVYDIVVDLVVVETVYTREQAYEYTEQFKLTSSEYTVVERTYSTVKGLGRDPDLH